MPRILAYWLLPHRLFLLLSLGIGLVYLILTPPFRAPDETGHFIRTLAYAHGAVWNSYDARIAYSDFFHEGNVARPYHRGAETVYDRETLDTIYQAGTNRKQDELKRLRADGPTVDLYSPAAYLPAIAVTAALEPFSPAPITSFYAMRLALLLSSCLLIAWAIKQMPFGSWAITLLALWPMALWHRAMITADSLTIAYGFALTALILRGLASDTVRSYAIKTTTLALLTALSKIVFVSLVGLLILPSFWRAFFGKLRLWIPLGIGLLAGAVAIGWNLMAKQALEHAIGKGMLGTQPSEQIAGIFTNPIGYIGILLDTLSQKAFWLNHVIIGSIGYLGEMDIPLSLSLCTGLLAVTLLMLFSASAGERPIGLWARTLCLAIFSGTALLTLTALYIQWNPLGSELIHGFQGRYILPVLPLLLFAFIPPQRWRFTPPAIMPAAILVLITALANGLTIRALQEAFYG